MLKSVATVSFSHRTFVRHPTLLLFIVQNKKYGVTVASILIIVQSRNNR